MKGHCRDRGWFSTFHVGASKRKRGVFLGTFLLVFKVLVNEGRRSIIRARTNLILFWLDVPIKELTDINNLSKRKKQCWTFLYKCISLH